MKISHKTTRGFTMIEIMVAVGIIVVLAAILIALVGGVNDKGKATSTQAKMNILGEAVEAFKQATGKYPLAVPEDAWANSWDDPDPTLGFATKVKWNGNSKQVWTDYFVPSSGKPNSNWNTSTLRPTNIQMLTFQLEQVPESNSILERLKQGSGQIRQMQFDNAGGWQPATSDCRIAHPLNPTAPLADSPIAFQPVDAWGTPLRFWTGDILPWAKRGGLAAPSWQPSVQQLLSDRLQKANWGFFIESAGKDGRFGWWGTATKTSSDPLDVNAQETEDNLYKP